MTDEELGKRLIPSWSSAATGTSEDYRRLGAAARELLAPPAINAPIINQPWPWIEEEFHRGTRDLPPWSMKRDVIEACARVAHRLATTPAIEHDPDCAAKALLLAYRKASAPELTQWNPDDEWLDISEASRNGWRAVAKAKEAGDA